MEYTLYDKELTTAREAVLSYFSVFCLTLSFLTPRYHMLQLESLEANREEEVERVNEMHQRSAHNQALRKKKEKESKTLQVFFTLKGLSMIFSSSNIFHSWQSQITKLERERYALEEERSDSVKARAKVGFSTRYRSCHYSHN